MIDKNEHWLLSFYRTSEISGSLFFGRLARMIPPGAVQVDMTKHFADEATHAWYWTECLRELGAEPLRLGSSYQDGYVEATGVPANLMEVLAITHAFERRVARQYTEHARCADLHPAVSHTIQKIMEDERWHLRWVSDALVRMEGDYGADYVRSAIQRARDADREVYERTIREQRERLEHLFGARQVKREGNHS